MSDRDDVDFDQIREDARQGSAGKFQMYSSDNNSPPEDPADGDLAVYDLEGNIVAKELVGGTGIGIAQTGNAITVTASGGGGGGGGQTIFEDAFANIPTGSPVGYIGQDLFFPTDAPMLWKANDSLIWEPFGPLFRFTAPPSVASLTAINSASGDDSRGIITLAAAAAAGWQARALVHSFSTPRKITIFYIANVLAVTYHKFGLCLRNSSSGKIIAFTKDSLGLATTRLNSATSYASTANQISGNGGHFGFGWLQMEVDASKFYCRWSNDGIQFVEVYNENLSTFISSVDEAGILANCENANIGCSGSCLSWAEA